MVLLAASAGSQLVDEVHQIPAGDWKFREIHLHQQAARISASYEVLSGSSKMRLALMPREDLERMREDLPGSIADTGEGRDGFLSDTLRRTGDYVVVLDNQSGKQAASVRLRIWLDFAPRRGTEPQQLAPQRRLTVVAISLALFFGIVSWSARRLLRAMKR
jgi:hypothetical protein